MEIPVSLDKDYIENLRINYFQNDLPVPYKLKSGNFINIYPIKVKDYPLYEDCKVIMDINKNEINDINIISKNYLEFLVDILMADEQNGDSIKIKFATFLSLILHKKYTSIEINNKNKYIICVQNSKNDENKICITSREFDEIRKISFYQNDSDYDDTYVSPDVKEAYEEYIKIKYRDVNSPSLEKQKIYVMSKTGYLIKDINEMSYRIFEQIYSISLQNDIYLSNKIIEASPKYDVKEKDVHPMFQKKKNKYAEIFSDTSILAKKGISGTNMLNNLN